MLKLRVWWSDGRTTWHARNVAMPCEVPCSLIWYFTNRCACIHFHTKPWTYSALIIWNDVKLHSFITSAQGTPLAPTAPSPRVIYLYTTLSRCSVRAEAGPLSVREWMTYCSSGGAIHTPARGPGHALCGDSSRSSSRRKRSTHGPGNLTIKYLPYTCIIPPALLHS